MLHPITPHRAAIFDPLAASRSSALNLISIFQQAVCSDWLAVQLEGAKEVHHHELRLRMDAAIGRTPPLQDGELQVGHHELGI